MKVQDFHFNLERGNILPLYYFYGPEKGLLNEALSRIEEKILNPTTREFNREIVDAEEEEWQTISDKIHTMPLGASRRLVIIRQAEGIWKKPASVLISYFEDPIPSTCAVFVGEKADLRMKFFQSLEKKGAAVGFYPPSDQEILRWLRGQAQQAGHTLSEDAASLLLELVGPNLQDLKAEIQKINSSLREGKKIEAADIEKLTENTRSESPFELPRAIGRFDLKRTLGLFRKTWQQGDAPPLLMALILRNLRMIRKAQGLKAKGLPSREIENRLHIHPREAPGFWEQVRKTPPHFWEDAWRLSLETDRGLKSSRGDKEMVMEEYLWSFYRLGKRGKTGHVGSDSDRPTEDTGAGES
jgi:DNA polymerase-3 subunit delta